MSASTASRFRALAEEYLRRFHEFHPTAAASLGFHEFDAKLPDLRPEAIADRIAELRRFQRALEQIDPADLSNDDAMDHAVLTLAAAEEMFEWEDLRDWQRNPMVYSEYCDVSGYLKRDYAPLDERLGALARHLAGLPPLLEAGWSNLRRPVPETFVTTAIEMFEGHTRFLDEQLVKVMESVSNDRLVSEVEKASRLAREAIGQMIGRLREELLPEATQDYAIGPDRYCKMLRLGEMVDVSLDRLVRMGEVDLATNEAAFLATAREIAPDKSPTEVMRLVAADHPTAESLVSDARATLDELAEFVRRKKLVSVPSDIPCIVEETPPFLRWAFAMMDTPGAFEEKATEAFYYVTPVESNWTAEQKDEWLRKFDYYTLRDVSAHEAYPGHYVHYLHYRQTPSAIRKTFGAYSFWEGWAHYVEQMMWEAGYGDGDPRLRLAQLSEALVRNCRYLVSIRLHTAGMTVDEATRFFMEHAYMDELPARKEAERGTFDPGYLNYTLGKLMLLKLRTDYAREQGTAFSLGAFHDRFLSYGAPPIPLVRQRMLQNGGTPPL